MAGSNWALQSAIHERLTTDAGITVLIGGASVWDHEPRGVAHPCITFGLSTERDWSTGSEPGSEHVLLLNVWSRAAGRHEVDDIAASVRAALHDQELVLVGHRLVNMQHELTEVRRDAKAEMYRGVLRFRAVTEPL